MSTSCYLGTGFSCLWNSVCLTVVTWMPTEFMLTQLFTSFKCIFNLRPRAACLLNPALTPSSVPSGQQGTRGHTANLAGNTALVASHWQHCVWVFFLFFDLWQHSPINIEHEATDQWFSKRAESPHGVDLEEQWGE